MKAKELKLIVKEKYGEIASQSKIQNQSSCCGSTGCCDDIDYSIFSDDYTKLEGYNADADLGLGCGLLMWPCPWLFKPISYSLLPGSPVDF